MPQLVKRHPFNEPTHILQVALKLWMQNLMFNFLFLLNKCLKQQFFRSRRHHTQIG